jgi:hypothetical protein
VVARDYSVRRSTPGATAKANDILHDDIDETLMDGISVRKGTVVAFLVNSRIWIAAKTSSGECSEAERDIVEALPALQCSRASRQPVAEIGGWMPQ